MGAGSGVRFKGSSMSGTTKKVLVIAGGALGLALFVVFLRRLFASAAPEPAPGAPPPDQSLAATLGFGGGDVLPSTGGFSAAPAAVIDTVGNALSGITAAVTGQPQGTSPPPALTPPASSPAPAPAPAPAPPPPKPAPAPAPVYNEWQPPGEPPGTNYAANIYKGYGVLARRGPPPWPIVPANTLMGGSAGGNGKVYTGAPVGGTPSLAEWDAFQARRASAGAPSL